MRKLTLTLLLLLISSAAYAGTITVDAFLTANDVTIPHLENFRSTVVGEINSFDGSTIQDGTITSSALDDNTNPENFRSEAFNDFVYTGLLPQTSVTLTATTTAGTAYISGVRVVKAATDNAYTASKDTYVDLSSTGSYTYVEVANGYTEPSVTDDSIRLAKVVTDADNVTSVSDQRVTSINLTTNADPAIYGMEISTEAPLAVVVYPGSLYNGTTRVSSTSNTTLTIGTAGDWWDGATDSYAGGAGWCYIGADSDGNIKLLGNNPPDKQDTAGTTDGRFLYWYDSSVPEYWRVIGFVRINTSNQVAYDYTQVGNEVYYTEPQSFTCGTQTEFTEVDITGVVPGVAYAALFLSSNSGATTNNRLRPADSATDNDQFTTYCHSENDYFVHGWIQSVAGTTYTKAIDYETGGNTMTGYVSAVRMALR